MTAARTVHSIRIDAPDGSAALELELRLAHLMPTTISQHGQWVVEIPAAPDVDEVRAVVAHWLADIGARSSVMRVDKRAQVVLSRRARKTHQASNAAFIG